MDYTTYDSVDFNSRSYENGFEEETEKRARLRERFMSANPNNDDAVEEIIDRIMDGDWRSFDSDSDDFDSNYYDQHDYEIQDEYDWFWKTHIHEEMGYGPLEPERMETNTQLTVEGDDRNTYWYSRQHKVNPRNFNTLVKRGYFKDRETEQRNLARKFGKGRTGRVEKGRVKRQTRILAFAAEV